MPDWFVVELPRLGVCSDGCGCDPDASPHLNNLVQSVPLSSARCSRLGVEDPYHPSLLPFRCFSIILLSPALRSIFTLTISSVPNTWRGIVPHIPWVGPTQGADGGRRCPRCPRRPRCPLNFFGHGPNHGLRRHTMVPHHPSSSPPDPLLAPTTNPPLSRSPPWKLYGERCRSVPRYCPNLHPTTRSRKPSASHW